jgi:hypothetical protein
LQLQRLLSVSFEGYQRVAPQLVEVAARIATRNAAWCDHLIATEPELLLRADASPLSDDQRERAIASLLRRAEREEAFDETGTGHFYHTLQHPGLAEQLRPYIENPSYNPVVRRIALGIAGDAKVSELEPLLWKRVEARDPAFGFVCGALHDIVGAQSHDRLLEALRGELPDDDASSLKDVALNKLVPAVLSVREVLPYLRPPPHESMTFGHGLAKHLSVEDLPAVLNVMAAGRLVGHDYLALNEIAARAFEMALDNLALPTVGDAFAQYWRESVRKYYGLPSRLMRRDANPLAGLENASKRRALLRLIIALPEAEPHDIDHAELRLIEPADASWLLEELPNVAPEHRAIWAKLSAGQLWQNLSEPTEELLRKRYMEFPELRTVLPAPTRFDIATTVRRLRQAHEKRRERIRARSARRFRRWTRTELLEAVWQELDTNDTVWVGFCDRAFRHEEGDPKQDAHTDRGDITASPGWIDADEIRRKQLRMAARTFLIHRRDGARRKAMWTNWADAAYFGIGLLRREIGADAELRTAVQENWPRVVFDDHDRGGAMQRAVITTVYQIVPEIGAARLALKLREDNSRNGYLLTLGCYVDCWDVRLAGVVREFLFSRGVKPRAIRRIFSFLAEHDRHSALVFFDAILNQRGGFRALDTRGRTLLSVALFVLVPERWDRAWAALEKSPLATARKVFLEAAGEYLDRDFDFHDALSSAQLTALCARVWQLFPAREFSERHDEHGHVSSRNFMPGLRDGLIGTLVTRATSEACAGIRFLATKVPVEERVWMQWRQHEAIKNALRRAWTAEIRTSAEILAMTRDFRAMTIDDADDLLDAVLGSLERLQHRLKYAESPELHALWNEPGRGRSAKPKDENILSDVIHDWITRDLGPNGGVVLNREVQATMLSKLDIKVEALPEVAGIAPLTVVIEVKGDWHPRVSTALRNQLAKQYLLPNGWSHGVYLVGWFGDRFTPLKKWPPATFAEVQRTVAGWREAQTPLGLTIRAFTLDCTIRQRAHGIRPASTT